MTDSSNGGTSPPNNGQSGGGAQGGAIPQRPPFPAVRLLYSVGYGFIAWFVLHIVFVLAAAQFAVLALNGKLNEELRQFSLTLVQYLWELLAFITFVRDEQPFPIGPFPKHA